MNEHGWNDPPVFTYSSLQTAGAGKRTQLNKRVNHDLSAPPPHPPPSTQTPPSNSDSDVGPFSAPPSNPNILTSQSPKKTEDSTDTKEAPPDKEVTLDSVLRCLDQVMERHKELISSRNENEVRSRLKFFSELWKTGKVSPKVQAEMMKLATALESGDYSLADKIHIALMVDHVSEVSRWMVGVKRLIAILKQAN